MKKFLSLVLSLAMAMSLVTVGAGAKEFKDDNKIAYDEAVAVISELGVVDGYESGNFNPEGGLTRGAAAKIICNMVLGPTTASALKADAKSFKDVPTNHPFAGYIAYCAQQGIINGYDSNTFKPEAPLTGNHFMKMLLGALGYDGEVEGFTGPNWTINVSKLAYGLKLDDGNKDAVLSKPITRQEAALYAFNTLKADMVEYDTKTTVSKGDLTVQIAGTDAKKILQRDSGYKDTMEPGVARDQQTLQFAEKYFDKLTMTGNGRDAFGRPATEWKYKSNVIDTFTDYSDMVAEYEGKKAPMGELYSTIGSSIIDKLNVKNGYSFDVYVNGAKVATPNTDDFFAKNSTKAAGKLGLTTTADGAVTGETGNGILTQVFMDDDSNVTISMINTYLVQATADFSTAKNEVTVETIDINATLPALDNKLSADDFDVEGVKEDDYLLVTYSYDSKGVETVTPATVQSGKVTQYTVGDNVVMDGTKYEYNAICDDSETEQEFSINENAALVLDQYGHVIHVDEAISSNSFVFIREFSGTSGLTTTAKAVANAYFTDGTNSEITVKKVDSEDSKSTIAGWKTDNAHAKWYTYIKNSDGEYTLTSMPNTSGKRMDVEVKNTASIAANTTIISGDKVAFLNVAGIDAGLKNDVLANKDTIFVTLDAKDKITVNTGVENMPEVKVSSAGTVDANKLVIDFVEKDNFAEYVFIDASKATNVKISGANVADYMMVLHQNFKKQPTVVDGSKYYTYDVLVDGKVETRMIEAASVMNKAGGLFYDIKVNSDKYIDDGTLVVDNRADKRAVVTLAKGEVTKNGNTLNVAGQSFYTTKDTKFNLVIADTAPDLMSDSGADYDAIVNTSLGTLTGRLGGYKVDGTAYVILNDKDSDLADAVYVYVTKSEEKNPSTPTPPVPTPGDSVLTPGEKVDFGGTTTFKYYKADGNTITNAEIRTVLEKNGATNVTNNVTSSGETWSFQIGATNYKDVKVTATQQFKVTTGADVKYVDKSATPNVVAKGSNKGTGVLVTMGSTTEYKAYGAAMSAVTADATVAVDYVKVSGLNANVTGGTDGAKTATVALPNNETYAKVGATLDATITTAANTSATKGSTVTLTVTGATAPAAQEITVEQAKTKQVLKFTITVAETDISAIGGTLADKG